ncbi:hypothetical protein [Rufibacter latericius]|uniref:DUF3098 domain-containing protein n=1 Tax=Rufibacter latericius TaxID=2487040 RepID=A0A3M9MNT8_9BACT|nr:hypothetical protein [Rufibacter latericius]RNI26513.1 hypothetical protein EFB08_11895 [Rufibacter latericius]
MNLKRTFGAILTILGIVGVIWGAYAFLAHGDSMNQISSLVPFVVGLIFFFTGISLIKGTKDTA